MARITYVEHNGTAHDVDVADGVSLMEGALGNGVPGIDGDCGGNAACATCHVYIDTAWAPQMPAISDMEEAMLDLADGREPNSRLACQVFARTSLDGMIVKMPETQH